MDDSSDTRLPIKIDATSNGEYAPIPLGAVEHAARRSALETADRATQPRSKFDALLAYGGH
jgi:uncharacterized protein